MMDSCVARYAEMKLSDDGWYAQCGADGYFWINVNDPNLIPDSLRGRSYSDLDEALEALCGENIPFPLAYVVRRGRSRQAAETVPDKPFDPRAIAQILKTMLTAIEAHGGSHATSSSGPT